MIYNYSFQVILLKLLREHLLLIASIIFTVKIPQELIIYSQNKETTWHDVFSSGIKQGNIITNLQKQFRIYIELYNTTIKLKS